MARSVPKPRRFAQAVTGKVLPTPAGNSGSPLFRSPSGVGSSSDSSCREFLSGSPPRAVASSRRVLAGVCVSHRCPSHRCRLPAPRYSMESMDCVCFFRAVPPCRPALRAGARSAKRRARANDRQKKGSNVPRHSTPGYLSTRSGQPCSTPACAFAHCRAECRVGKAGGVPTLAIRLANEQVGLVGCSDP